MSTQQQPSPSEAAPKTYKIEPASPVPPVTPPASDRPAAEMPSGFRIDLLQFGALKWLVKRRWFQFAVILPNLLFFMVFLVAGVFGSPVGNRNIIIIFVWILWWFLLISVMVPFASRLWCTMCPFPFFGEWLQRRSLVKVGLAARGQSKKGQGPGTQVGRNLYFGRNWRWPKALSNIWLQNIGFLFLCTFSALFLTRPIVSVVVLGGLFVIATFLHLLYRQRAFCMYVCPVSGFLSLYSMTAMAEVRSKEEEVCAKCTDKGCLAGNEQGWGCPWFMYPSKMVRNNYCGLCMECVKTCPHDNMTVYLRPFCSDTQLKGYDEAWKAFIMLSLALTYSVLYQGPWGFLKDWANVAEKKELGGFLIYAAALWLGALVVVPALFAGAIKIGRWLAGPHSVDAKDAFLAFTYPVVPLGLFVWVAFSFPLVLVNGSYIPMVLSDPLGWGWDLFGTAHLGWTPVVPEWTPFVQAPLILIGFAYALKTGYAHALRLFEERATHAFAPVAILLTVLVLGFLRLYTG